MSYFEPININKHKENRNKKVKYQQNVVSTLSAFTNSKSDFNDDLCRALILSVIPLFKLKHFAFKNCIGKHAGCKIPGDRILRKNYVGSFYEETIFSKSIEDELVGVKIDETTDT